MADPKYADLPGIAYDQPDVYETGDLPEADQNTGFYEEESDSIERLHISANEAFSRFKGKSLTAANVDFSDRISKNRRSGYDVRNWELVGEGEKETPFQKYQRLQLEIAELADEVAQIKDGGKEQEAGQPSAAALAQHIEESRRQLAEVSLQKSLGCEPVVDLLDPEGSQIVKLMADLDALKKQSEGSGAAVAGGKAAASTPGVVSYELQFRPEQAGLERSGRLAQLETRLHRLESALGATPERMAVLGVDGRGERGRPAGLLQAVQMLSAKLSLLDAQRLDQVEGRLIALSQKMDTLAEKNAARGQDVDRDKKVAELYDLVKKNNEEVSQILPQTLDRMLALQALHQQAADFGKSLSQLEAVQQQVSSSLHSTEALLKNEQESFSKRVETLQESFSSLDKRISALGKK